MPGGEPFGLLVIDHAIRHRRTPDAPTDDVGALAQLSSAAAAAFSPVVLSAHPSLLELDGFDGLSHPAGCRGAVQRNRVCALAQPGDAVRIRGFIAVTLPRLLARLPWGDDPARRDGFRYREYAPDPASRTWMNAAYAFAALRRAGLCQPWLAGGCARCGDRPCRWWPGHRRGSRAVRQRPR